jgi:L-ascorbate metabolism protein UlaG (beta-lactamase superfamily)
LDVTWHGHACFRLRGRSAAAVTDPYPPALGPRLRLEANVVTVSHPHENHAYVGGVVGDPFVVDGPGEYEVAGITVTGLPSYHDGVEGAEHGRNTVFVLEIDDVRVCHLGDLGHKPDATTTESLGVIDVLLVPVGGSKTINPAAAAEVVRLIEPRYVVPMHYSVPGMKEQLGTVDTFLKEMGVAAGEPLQRLSLQATSGEVETPKVIVLEART